MKPSVQNGVIQFSVELVDSRNASLRPNQKVDVFVVTNRSSRAVRVANGPAFKGKKKQFVWVMSSPTTAVRREAVIGLSNFDWVEVISGLQPGERVITTDLSQYEHLQQLNINPKP